MKSRQRILAILPTITLLAVLLSGCRLNISIGIDDYLTADSYPNAESYQTGAFTYEADQVKRIEIYWRSGEVEIVESDRVEFSVRESGGELPEDIAMHYLLENGTLRIRFCESGAKIHVYSKDKHLTVEVPKGMNLSVHTTSAPVKADALQQESILISAHSGRTELGTVKAESVNLNSSSGSLWVDRICAKALKCNTSSGSIHIDDLEAETADLETSSGSVELALSAVAQLDIHTSSGRTVLHLPGGGAEIAYTASSGKLHTTRTFERKGSLYVFGKGESKITVHSSSGNLDVQ